MAMTKKTTKPATGFNKPVQPDAVLGKIVGTDPLSRGQITKKLWAYIKKHDLQDPKNKRNVNADAKLRDFFGKKQVTMFEISKLVSAHLA